MEKRVEVEIGDSDEEVGGGRRRSGRIAKTHGRFRQLACRSKEEEDDTNSKESNKNLGDDQEKGKDETN
jgi:hypothetical protein